MGATKLQSRSRRRRVYEERKCGNGRNAEGKWCDRHEAGNDGGSVVDLDRISGGVGEVVVLRLVYLRGWLMQ